MARIAGIQTKKNTKGVITHVTIDLRRHKEALPFLEQIGALERDDFEEKWNDPTNMTPQEARQSTLEHVRSLWSK